MDESRVGSIRVRFVIRLRVVWSERIDALVSPDFAHFVSQNLYTVRYCKSFGGLKSRTWYVDYSTVQYSTVQIFFFSITVTILPYTVGSGLCVTFKFYLNPKS